MHRVDIAVTHVDPDGLQGEAVLLPWGVDNNGRLQAAGAEWKVPIGGGVTGWRVGGQGAWRDGTGLEAAGGVVWKKNTGTFPSVSHSFSHTFCPLLDLIKFCTCSDDERQCWDWGRLWDLPSTGQPLSVWGLQLVTEAPRASGLLGGWVFAPCAVAANPDPPEVWHNYLSCRKRRLEKFFFFFLNM